MSREKKIKVILLGISLFNIALVIMRDLYFCTYDFYENCIMIGYGEFLSGLFWISISIFLTSIFTFFISDKIFKKWLKFTFWWFLVAIIWIAISPDSVNFLAIPATKENVSIWMSVGFVIISIIMFIWMSIKEKNKK